MTAEIGKERTAPNGYQYVKTASGWRLKHHVIFEKHNGRPVNSALETIRFKDGNLSNLAPENIVSQPRGAGRLKSRIAGLEARIASLQAELEYYQKLLNENVRAAS